MYARKNKSIFQRMPSLYRRCVLPLLLAVLSVPLCVGCSADDAVAPSGGSLDGGGSASSVPILLSGSIADGATTDGGAATAETAAAGAASTANGATRAGTTLFNAFAGGEKIAVSIYNTDNNNAVIGKEDMEYTVNTTDKTTLTPPTDMKPSFPTTTQGNVKIRAVYPTTAATEGVTVEKDQTSDANYKKGELLWVSTTAKRQKSAVALTFQHRMAKIVVNLNSGNGSPTLPTTVLLKSFQCTAKVSKSTGTVTTSGNKEDITMSANGAAMVPPQTHAKAVLFEIQTAQGDKRTYTPTKELKFEAGYVYTYDVQVDMRQITVTSTISTWGDNTNKSNPFTGELKGEE